MPAEKLETKENKRKFKKINICCICLKVGHGQSLEVPNTFYVQSKNVSVELYTKLVALTHTFEFHLSTFHAY